MKRRAALPEGDRNIMLVLAYDGTGFKGWQRLAGAQRTVQETLEALLSGLLGERINLMGSGRTDAGVHAAGQAANFHTVNPIALEALLAALDAILPADIACVCTRLCQPSFHARYRALEKTYSYLFREGSSGEPGLNDYSLAVKSALDDGRIREAADEFAGTLNFRAFTNAKTDELDFIRTVAAVSLNRRNGVVRLGFRGEGFMFNQVRLMASALMLAGLGRLASADIRGMLATGVRHPLVGALGAHGLCLDAVSYRREDFLSEPECGNLPGLRSLGTNLCRGWLKKLAGAGLSSTSTLPLNGI